MNAPFSPFDERGAQFAWDSTSIKAAERCARYYQYKLIDGWRSPFESVHLWFGGIYASSLEAFHEAEAAGADREDAIRLAVRHALVESWDHDRDAEGNRIPDTGKPGMFDNPQKTRDNLIRTIVWYFEHFKEERLHTLILSNGRPAVEHSFQIPVDDGILFSGHLDRVIEDNSGDKYVHDQKTTTQTISPHYFKQFKPDTQFTMYPFAGKMIYDTPISGVIIDAAQIAVGFSRFARCPTTRTEDELDEWYEETMMLIERTRRYTLDGFFPRNPASCNNYGGCEFREICTRPPHVRENFLQGDFVKGEPWNPLRQR